MLVLIIVALITVVSNKLSDVFFKFQKFIIAFKCDEIMQHMQHATSSVDHVGPCLSSKSCTCSLYFVLFSKITKNI